MDIYTLLLAFLSLASMGLYFPLNKGHARYFLMSSFDEKIPFLPIFIWPYLSLFPFIFIGLFIAFSQPIAPALYLALIIGVLSGSLVRYFVHSGIRQPRIRRHDVSSRLVHWLYRCDDRARTFPSSHVLISIIISYFLALAFPVYALSIWVIGLLITVSTVFVKQHYLIDVAGGLFFVIGAIWVTHMLLPYIF